MNQTWVNNVYQSPEVHFAFQEGPQVTLLDLPHPTLDEINEGPNFSLSMHAARNDGSEIVCVYERIGLVLFCTKR